jgi:hypothetical protein
MTSVEIKTILQNLNKTNSTTLKLYVKKLASDCEKYQEALKDVIRNSSDIIAKKRCSNALFGEDNE